MVHDVGRRILGVPLGVVCLGVALGGCSAASDVPAIDLDGPRLVDVGLPHDRALSPTAAFALEFSESIDVDRAQDDGVLLVPFETSARCDGDACEAGDCYGGWCQRSVVDEAWETDANHPPLTASRQAKVVPLRLDSAGSATQIIAQPMRPLQPLRYYDLIVSSAITDRSGNPLQAPTGQIVPLRWVFATASAEVARPVVTLIAPPREAQGVPTNLGRVVISFSKHVEGITRGSFWLERDDGRRVELDPGLKVERCQGQHEYVNCYVLAVEGELTPNASWSLRATETIRDSSDQGLVFDGRQQFRTGAGPDGRPQPAVRVRWVVADGCAVARFTADGAVDVWIGGSGAVRSDLVLDAREGVVSALLDPRMSSATLMLNVCDRRGRGPTTPVPAVSVSSAVAPLVLTEVLANPEGPEPAQEYVEIFNRSEGAVDLADWIVDDNDDGRGAVVLPSALLLPGSYAVLVGPAYDSDAGVVGEEDRALLVHLNATIGERGLANSGERLVLRSPDGGLASSYGGWLPEGSAGAGQSVERISPRACDIPASWRGSGDGGPTPGRGPLLSGPRLR